VPATVLYHWLVRAACVRVSPALCSVSWSGNDRSPPERATGQTVASTLLCHRFMASIWALCGSGSTASMIAPGACLAMSRLK
jgi:hypothetical protein